MIKWFILHNSIRLSGATLEHLQISKEQVAAKECALQDEPVIERCGGSRLELWEQVLGGLVERGDELAKFLQFTASKRERLYIEQKLVEIRKAWKEARYT